MDVSGPGSAAADDTVYPVDNNTGESLAPVEHHVSHRADDELVIVNVQDAVLDIPLAEPEDARDPVPFDPLEASPLLATFQRVQQAYERWLVNMSHAVTLYQGRFF